MGIMGRGLLHDVFAMVEMMGMRGGGDWTREDGRVDRSRKSDDEDLIEHCIDSGMRWHTEDHSTQTQHITSLSQFHFTSRF
jgi:hypothetical protein